MQWHREVNLTAPRDIEEKKRGNIAAEAAILPGITEYLISGKRDNPLSTEGTTSSTQQRAVNIFNMTFSLTERDTQCFLSTEVKTSSTQQSALTISNVTI
jgi:hypothetical protein